MRRGRRDAPPRFAGRRYIAGNTELSREPWATCLSDGRRAHATTGEEGVILIFLSPLSALSAVSHLPPRLSHYQCMHNSGDKGRHLWDNLAENRADLHTARRLGENKAFEHPLSTRDCRNLLDFQPLFRVNIPMRFRFSRTELRWLKRQLLLHKKAIYASNAGTTFNGLFDVPPKRERVRAEICEAERDV